MRECLAFLPVQYLKSLTELSITAMVLKPSDASDEFLNDMAVTKGTLVWGKYHESVPAS